MSTNAPEEDWQEEPEWFDEFCDALDELELEDELALEALVDETLEEVEALRMTQDSVELNPSPNAKYRRQVDNLLANPDGARAPAVPGLSASESLDTELSSLAKRNRTKAQLALTDRRSKCSA